MRRTATILFALGGFLLCAHDAFAAALEYETGGYCSLEPTVDGSTPVIKVRPAPAEPIPGEDAPPWAGCLERVDPQMCANCCQYWENDCTDACPDPDPGSNCWYDCVFAKWDCVDACFGI